MFFMFSFFDEPAMLTDMIGASSSLSFLLVAMSAGKFFDRNSIGLQYGSSQV